MFRKIKKVICNYTGHKYKSVTTSKDKSETIFKCERCCKHNKVKYPKSMRN